MTDRRCGTCARHIDTRSSYGICRPLVSTESSAVALVDQDTGEGWYADERRTE